MNGDSLLSLDAAVAEPIGQVILTGTGGDVTTTTSGTWTFHEPILYGTPGNPSFSQRNNYPRKKIKQKRKISKLEFLDNLK